MPQSASKNDLLINKFLPVGYELKTVTLRGSRKLDISIEGVPNTEPWLQEPAYQSMSASADPSLTQWSRVERVNKNGYGYEMGIRIFDIPVKRVGDVLFSYEATSLEKEIAGQRPTRLHFLTPIRHFLTPIRIGGRRSVSRCLPLSAPVSILTLDYAVPPNFHLLQINLEDNTPLGAECSMTSNIKRWDLDESHPYRQILTITRKLSYKAPWCQFVEIDPIGYGYKSGLREYDLLVESIGCRIRFADKAYFEDAISQRPFNFHVLRREAPVDLCAPSPPPLGTLHPGSQVSVLHGKSPYPATIIRSRYNEQDYFVKYTNRETSWVPRAAVSLPAKLFKRRTKTPDRYSPELHTPK